MFVIGDVHGRLDKLTRLLAKLDPSEEVVFVGDLIDRGPQSREVVKFVREGKYRVVRGNHEQMMIDALSSVPLTMYDLQPWTRNGGGVTLASYGYSLQDILDLQEDLPVSMLSDLRWMGTLPHYLEVSSPKDDSGRSLIVSHSYALPYLQAKDTPKGQDDIMWNRSWWPNPLSGTGFFNIFGHSIVRQVPFIYGDIACIDTGAYRETSPLSALHWPTLEVVSSD
jgi:serine/threonine protein phosphatase 1